MLIQITNVEWVNVGNARTIEIGKSKFTGKTVLVVTWLGDNVWHDDYKPWHYAFENESLVKAARAKLNA